jgi:hypothetical protein
MSSKQNRKSFILGGYQATAKDRGIEASADEEGAKARDNGEHLDITQLNSHLFASGMLWTRRTEKNSCRNNVEDFAKYLRGRFNKRFLIWNLSFVPSPSLVGINLTIDSF